MKTILLIALELAASGSDAYFTHRNLTTFPFREHNPIMQPFVRNTPSMVITFAASSGGFIFSEHWLRRHGKGKFADTLAAGDISAHIWGAAYSAKNYKP